jgi:hypothetical protein
MYPYFVYRDNGQPGRIDLNYALFQPSSTTMADPANGLTYTNLFDAMMDRAGGVDVVVSQNGRPLSDGRGASVDNARTYNQNLIDDAGKGRARGESPGRSRRSTSSPCPIQTRRRFYYLINFA